MKALRTEDLNNIIQTNAVTRKSYLGTFPSCVFPKTNKQVYTFVSNTSDHLDTGEHWVCWFINGTRVSFIDSYGRSPYNSTLPYHFKSFMNDFRTVQYSKNKKQIQGRGSIACGYFVINFIYVFCLGLNYDNFLNDYFRYNFEENDYIVNDFVNSIAI